MFFSIFPCCQLKSKTQYTNQVSLCLNILLQPFLLSHFFSLTWFQYLNQQAFVEHILCAITVTGEGKEQRPTFDPEIAGKFQGGGDKIEMDQKKKDKIYTQNGYVVLWKSMGFEIKCPLIYHLGAVEMSAKC